MSEAVIKVPAVELRDVAFSYGKKEILSNASMKVMPGEVVGIVGLSGSGKTTLIRLINGAMAREGRHAYTGQILIGGIGVSELGHLNQHVGTIYQDTDSQLIFTNALDEIVFGMENHCFSKETMDARLSQVTAQLGIGHLLDKNPNQLSGGEKQLVVLASILCLDVTILILDEAMSGVDATTRSKVLSVIGQMRDEGKSVLMIEHNHDNLAVADRIYKVENKFIQLVKS